MAHTGWVRRLARTLVRDPAAADDLAHDALLVALDRPPEVREGIRSWFGRVLTNRLRMDARASRRRAAREQAVMGLVAASSTPEEVAQRLELQRRLAEAMLSSGCRRPDCWRAERMGSYPDQPPADDGEAGGDGGGHPAGGEAGLLTRARGLPS
jgi:hypothetical protein